MTGGRVVAFAAGLAVAVAPAARASPLFQGLPDRPLTDARLVIARKAAGAAPIPVARLFDVRDSLGAVWAADGRSIIVSTNLTGRYNLWRAPLAGGAPRRITTSDDLQRGLAPSPDGTDVVFQSDRAGDEIDDLFAVSLRTGRVVNLTATPGVAEQGARFSRDGRSLAFSRRPAANPSADLAVMDLATRKVRVLTKEPEPNWSWTAVGFTDGDRSLIANRTVHGQVAGEVWRLDMASGAAIRLAPRGGEAITATDVSADGRWVAVTVEAVDGSRQAALLDRQGRLRLLQPDVWEQKSGHFSRDGRLLAFSRNVDGRTRLALYDVASGRARELPLPAGVNEEAGAGQGSYVNPDGQTGFSPGGDAFLAAHQSSTTPMDYWVVDLKTQKARPVTGFGRFGLGTVPLPSSQLVHYASQDGTVISAFMWTPLNLRRDRAAPAIVMPHGGPAHQRMDDFNREAIAFVSRGYVVIAPNVRGSSGYGRAFEAANHKDLGGGDLQDLVAAVDFLKATGFVDAGRIGVTGGSYGGYLTLQAVARRPELWAAAAEEYGIVDWADVYRHAGPPLRRYVETLLGAPDTDASVYAASSPATVIDQVTAPLLVLQGDHDIRVPKAQAEMVTRRLTAAGRTVEAHYYPDEGHGFVKRENQIDALERVIGWFDTHLKRSAGR